MRCSRVRFLAAVFGASLAFRAQAAPIVGPPFFVADPLTAREAVPGVAATSSGFIVAWVAERELAYRHLDSSGALGRTMGVVARAVGTRQPGHFSTTYPRAPVELESLGDEALLAFQSTTDSLSRAVGNTSEFRPQSAFLGGTGSSVPGALGATAPIPLPFAITARDSRWASLQWSMGWTGPLTLTFRHAPRGTVVTRTLVSHPVTLPPTPGFEPRALGVATNGTDHLVAWAEGATIFAASISDAGEVGEIVQPEGWTTRGLLRVASNGNGYLVAWADASRTLRVAAVDARGPAASVVGTVATAAERVLDLDAAGSDYLLVYESASEGGVAVRAARVGPDGSVRDPDGFDLASTTEVAVSPMKSGVWLMVQASHADPERTLLEGRFIGDVVPEAPDNEVPPPSSRADAGTPWGGGPTGDGGASGGGAPGSGGRAGGETGSGGARSMDAGTREPPTIESRGCDCGVAGRKHEVGASAAAALLGLLLAGRKRRSVNHGV